MVLVKAARPEVDHSPDALEERLRRLESGSVPFPRTPATGGRPAPPQPAGQRATQASRALAGGSPPAVAPAVGAAASATPDGAPPPLPKPASSAARGAATSLTADPAPATDESRGATASPPDEPAAPDGSDAPDDPPAPGDPAATESPDPVETAAAAPVPTPAAAPPAADADAYADDASSTGGGEPEVGAARVKRAWQLILQQTEGQSVGLYAAIRDAHVRTDGERLVVALPSSLALGKASAPDNRELLLAIIARTTGDTPDIQFVHERAAATPAERPQTVPDAGLTIAQRIALAKRELDASDLPDE
jgi:hypothetical protein